MPRVWDTISKESQDNLTIAMFLVQKKEAPELNPSWTPPDKVTRAMDDKDEKGWKVIGSIESPEEIDRLMRQPDIRRVGTVE